MFRAQGARGEVWVDTTTALVLGRWSLEAASELGQASTVRAAITHVDPFWATQRPFVLALDFGPVWWVWTETHCVRLDPLVLTVRGDPLVKEK